ncbi:hypothetical protein HMPREF9018_0716 [Prevotella amnii CRIS 21A-A]|uniref:Uncharacterized protein n=1 Tax=Prevotella amnii CRIS 21A-A TaxID=679191 RepID=E1GWZ6_9BACT|nr:hypothetical protein HMPREF9018_0716 [Prevotella amnii CRIS 21A-A]
MFHKYNKWLLIYFPYGTASFYLFQNKNYFIRIKDNSNNIL